MDALRRGKAVEGDTQICQAAKRGGVHFEVWLLPPSFSLMRRKAVENAPSQCFCADDLARFLP